MSHPTAEPNQPRVVASEQSPTTGSARVDADLDNQNTICFDSLIESHEGHDYSLRTHRVRPDFDSYPFKNLPASNKKEVETTTRIDTNAKSTFPGLILTDLLKLRITLDQTVDLNDACQVVAESLGDAFDCNNVFVSLFQSGRLSLKGEVDDSYSVSDSDILAAQQEVASDTPIVGWPTTSQWTPSVVHRQLTNHHNSAAFSILMKNRNAVPVGVVTLIADKSTCVKAVGKTQHILDLCIPHLQLIEQASESITKKLLRNVRATSLPGWNWLLGIAVVFLLSFVQIPHRIQCSTEAKPVVRRFVSAPFDSVLKNNLVFPGDFVDEGQVLGRLDGDELRLQQSSIDAEIEKYKKQKSLALANGEHLEFQQAVLELRRLHYKSKLLTNRNSNLNITSPISGVVLSSELEDAVGAPLDQGQLLYEVAPLNRLMFHVYIAQDDIGQVEKGMPVSIKFNASTDKFLGTIRKIRPQATLFENRSVFVAEVVVDNQQTQVRPGMQGVATVTGDTRSVGWILFRKPANAIKRVLGF